MTDLESRLTAVLRADAPPERDALFRVKVLARLERARFRRRVALTMIVALIAATLAAPMASAIDVWASSVSVFALAAAGAIAAVLALSGLVFSTPSGVITAARSFGRWLYP